MPLLLVTPIGWLGAGCARAQAHGSGRDCGLFGCAERCAGFLPASAPALLEVSPLGHGLGNALGSSERELGMGKLSPQIPPLPLQSVDSEDSFVPGRRASLSDLTDLEDIEGLTVRQLKEILARNFVNYKGCCEKWELMERVTRLYKDQKGLQHLGEALPRRRLLSLCSMAASP